MDEHQIVRSLLLRIAQGVPAMAPRAKAVLEWAQPHAAWLLADDAWGEGELDWERLLGGVQAAVVDLPPVSRATAAG